MTQQKPSVLHVRRRTLDLATYKGRSAQATDYTTLITGPTIVYDDDCRAVVLVYLLLEEDCTELVAALRRVHIGKSSRTNGLTARARNFGYSPRVTIRNDYCRTAKLAAEDPAAHALIASYAAVVERAYARYNPDLYARHAEAVDEHLLAEWALEDGVFTSGIINRDSLLPYHLDTGNVRGMWSGMLGFKRHVVGGYLAVPEYDLALEVADNSLTLFDGQGLVHGVTPFTLLSPDAYRLTVVFYSLQGMWNCLPIDEEVARIQQRRTQLERARVRRRREE